MSDIDGAAAPAEGIAAPEAEAVSTPNPVSTEPEGHVEAEAKEAPKPVKSDAPAKPLTAREALQKAAEKVEKDNSDKPKEVKAEAKSEDDKAKPVAVEPAKRDETGKFAPKDDAKPEQPKPSHTAGDAPARFTETAKLKWASADPEIRGEVSRMERELTQGYEKHKAAAERDASLNEFHEMAQSGGTTVKDALSKYVNTENTLRRDLVGGLDEICQRMGVSLRDVAAKVLGQTPDQQAGAQEQTIHELRQKNQTLEDRLNKIEGGLQQQKQEAVLADVQKFEAAHPRFEELSGDIAFFLQTRTKDLSEAYSLAERLNPAPAQASPPAASTAPVIDLKAQADKGSKSINGAPSHGSDPVSSKPSTSIKESLRKAIAAAG